MSVRPVLRYPDPRLAMRAEPVAAFDDTLSTLASDLLDTMRAAPGVGIAGPHIGSLLRILVVQISPDEPVWTCVNPEIVSSSETIARHSEGSISLPGVAEDVERPDRVLVRYRDLGGGEQVVDATGLLAVCLQHEIDQLDGIFWLKRLSRLKRDRVLKRFSKLR